MDRTEQMTAASAPSHEIRGSYVDWAAVLGGAVVAAATGVLFATFGAALGLSTVSAEEGEASSINLWLVVSGLWIVVTLAASYFAGGYIAGRMRRRLDDASADEVSARDGINGLVVWGLGLLVMAWMAAGLVGSVVQTAGNAAAGAADLAGGAIGAAGQAAGGVAEAAIPDDGDGAISWISDSLLRPALGAPAPAAETAPAPGDAPAPTGNDTAELARQSASVLANVLRTGEISDEDRAYLTAATAEATGLAPAEAEARVEAAITSAQDARTEVARLAEEAEATARDVAEVARKGSILTAFLLAAASLVAAAAALGGGVMGGRHRDEGRIFGGFSYR